MESKRIFTQSANIFNSKNTIIKMLNERIINIDSYLKCSYCSTKVVFLEFLKLYSRRWILLCKSGEEKEER